MPTAQEQYYGEKETPSTFRLDVPLHNLLTKSPAVRPTLFPWKGENFPEPGFSATARSAHTDRAKSFQTLRSERYFHLSGALAASRRTVGLVDRKKQVRIQDGELR
jgi:hypothetical protein